MPPDTTHVRVNPKVSPFPQPPLPPAKSAEEHLSDGKKPNASCGTIWKKLFSLCGVYLLMFLIIFFSKELSEGIRGGVNVAMNLLIPSMFLFLIFSNAVIHSSLRNAISRPFRFLARYVFRIPDSDTAIVVLSLVGGYPVGAKLLGDAVREGKMSRAAAERMLAYCVNCGPAFLISGVGASIFGNLQLGVCLCLSQVTACIIVGFLSSFERADGLLPKRRKCPSALASRPEPKISGAVLLVNSVNDAVKALGIICGFVVAFSSLLPVLNLFMKHLNPDLAYVVQGFLEVTGGCGNLPSCKNLDRVLLAQLFTAFGGVCVHLQVYAMLKSAQIRMRRFFIFRPVYVLVSVLALRTLLAVLPGATNCISFDRSIPQQFVSVSPAATVFLILLGIMLLFFRKKSDKMKDTVEFNRH